MTTYRPLIHPEITIKEQREDGFAGSWKHLLFICSLAVELDGQTWLHASVSRKDCNMPTYSDLMDLKRLCIGDHRTALQVFPPREKHINVAGQYGVEVLHLWCCLSRNVTPDFTRGGKTI